MPQVRTSCPKMRPCVEMAYDSEPVAACEGGRSALMSCELYNLCAAALSLWREVLC